MPGYLRPPLELGIVATHPPTQCGLATFAYALEQALERQGHHVHTVAVDAAEGESLHPLAGVLTPGSHASMRRTAAVLSKCDVALIQHEFGIFGGPDGDEIVEVTRDVDSPIIVTLHTVPLEASVHRASILVSLCEVADRVVVMSNAARERLVGTYAPIDAERVVVIPHGAVRVTEDPGIAHLSEVLTWGLIGPGKGIEHVIRAIGLLHQLGVDVRYTIAGSTHPKVKAKEGERYRDMLRDLAHELNVEHLVTFDEQYRDVEELTRFISTAGVVVLPYDSHEQITSGVLTDSLAAGCAVIATEFPHAVELLGDGAGLLVPHADPQSLAVAMRTVTSEPRLVAQLRARARELSASFDWDVVAEQYVELARDCVLAHA